MGHFLAPTRYFRVSCSALGAATAAVLLASSGVLADEDPADDIPDQGLDLTVAGTSFGGADPLATSRTVQHWSDETANSANGVTYRYNMVGADPRTNGSAVIGVDIVPLDLTVDGHAFNGSQVAPAVLASPLFSTTTTAMTQTGPVTVPLNYGSTSFASNGMGGRGSGGQLSPGQTNLQLLDATMRAQFNKVGTTYHLILDPVVHDAVTIDIPDGKGTTLTSPGGITFAILDVNWFRTRIQNQLGKLGYLDPSRLVLFVTYDVALNDGLTVTSLSSLALGAHGAGPATGNGNGNVRGNGKQPVQTFAWGSWLTTGFFSRTRMWAMQDIHALSHEIVEWADNPFGTNTVQDWFVARASQYGCSDELETGDPVVGLGFTIGYHRFDDNRFSEHTWHPSDEALLPWFMRSAPETQGGRFTFMGSLNRVMSSTTPSVYVFQQPATGCPA